MDTPKAIIYGYMTKDEVSIDAGSATEFWLGNEDGSSFFLKWWGNGWVIKHQSSYLCKDKEFKHESEIPAFLHSSYGPAETWQHVYATKAEAVEMYRTRRFPIHVESEAFYTKVYDILMILGGAPLDYRKAFLFNFSKQEKYPDREWRFQGKLGFGGKYRNETNRVDCYSEDETPEIKEIINQINEELKALENEKQVENIE